MLPVIVFLTGFMIGAVLGVSVLSYYYNKVEKAKEKYELGLKRSRELDEELEAVKNKVFEHLKKAAASGHAVI